MRRLLFPILLLLFLTSCILALFFSSHPRDNTQRWLDYQQQELQLQRQRAEFQQDLDRKQALEPIQRLANILDMLSPYLLFGTILYIGIDMYRQRRRPLVHPDSRGILPVPRGKLEQDTGLRLAALSMTGYHQAQIEQAKASINVPHSFTYAPRINGKDITPISSEPLHTAAQITCPSFTELLSQQLIGKGNSLILGYASQKPLLGTWKDLYSSAVAGISGSGKTTTIRFLACQSALYGAQFVLLDPHADAGEESLATTLQPLLKSFLCEPASTENEMLSAIHMVRSCLEMRLQGKQERTPLIIAVDEFSRLMARSSIASVLGSLLEGIAQEGRKVGIYGLISGQVWTAERAGGSALRDSLASCYVHRLKRSQARMLLPSDDAREVEKLEAGQALLSRTSGDCRVVSVPLTTIADVQEVAYIIASEKQSVSNQNEASNETKNTSLDRHETLTADEIRIVELFRSGRDVAAIVKELWPEAQNGARYQQRSTEVQSVLRKTLRG